jgi:hypothetical protein
MCSAEEQRNAPLELATALLALIQPESLLLGLLRPVMALDDVPVALFACPRA